MSNTGVYREYPNQPLPRPNSALWPAQGNPPPVRGPATAMTAWWPDYPTQMPRVNVSSVAAPVSAPSAPPSVLAYREPDYPIQVKPFLKPLAANLTPPSADYVFTGPSQPAVYQRPELSYPPQQPIIEPLAPFKTPPDPLYRPTGIPSQPASYQRPDLSYPNQGPLLNDTAVIDDTVLVVVADVVPLPNAYDREPYPWPSPPTYFATLAPPQPSKYLVPPPPVQGVWTAEYPTQGSQLLELLAPTVAPPPVAAYVFPGLTLIPGSTQRSDSEYPTQPPLIEALAPFQTFPGAAYVFAGPAAMQGAAYQDRAVWTWPVLPSYLAALAAPPAVYLAPPPLAQVPAADYPTQEPLLEAAVFTPVNPVYLAPGIPTQPAAYHRPELVYPNQGPLTHAASGIATLPPPPAPFVPAAPPPAVSSAIRPDPPIVLSLTGTFTPGLLAGYAYVFTGIPSQPAAYQRPDQSYPNQSPLTSVSAGVDAQTQAAIVPASPVPPAAYQRPELIYPNQSPLIEPLAGTLTPAGAVYVFTGLPYQPAAYQRPELAYPSQEPLLEFIAPLAIAPPGPFVFASPPAAVMASARPDASLVLSLTGGLAPFLTPAGAAYVFAGLPFVPGATQRPDLSYPNQSPFTVPLAASLTVPSAAYMFTGLPFLPASIQRPELTYPNQGPLLEVSAFLDAQAQAAFVPPKAVHPAAFQRPELAYPNQPPLLAPTASIATLPLPSAYMFSGIPSQPAGYQRPELAYPSQGPLIEAIAPLVATPSATYVFTGLPWNAAAYQRPELSYPGQQPLIAALAPLGTPPGAVYVFTGIPYQPASYQRPELSYPNQGPLLEVSAFLDAQAQAAFVPPKAVHPASYQRPDLTYPNQGPLLEVGALLDAQVKAGYVPVSPVLGKPDRIDPPPLQPAPPMSAFLASVQGQAFVPPVGVLRWDRSPEPLIQPVRLFSAVFTLAPLQLAPGEIIAFGIPDDRVISITVDDRRIYPVPSTRLN